MDLRAYGFATLPFHCLLGGFEGEYRGWPRMREPQLHSLKADHGSFQQLILISL